MKTTKTISMAEFLNEVKKIADKKNEDFYYVGCEVRHNQLNGLHYIFKSYINGYGSFQSDTPNKVISMMKKAIFPKKSIIKEVEV